MQVQQEQPQTAARVRLPLTKVAQERPQMVAGLLRPQMVEGLLRPHRMVARTRRPTVVAAIPKRPRHARLVVREVQEQQETTISIPRRQLTEGSQTLLRTTEVARERQITEVRLLRQQRPIADPARVPRIAVDPANLRRGKVVSIQAGLIAAQDVRRAKLLTRTMEVGRVERRRRIVDRARRGRIQAASAKAGLMAL